MLFRTANPKDLSPSYTKSGEHVLLMPHWTLAEPQCYVTVPYSNPIAMCEILVPDALIASPECHLPHHDVVAETLAIGGRGALLLRRVQDRVSFHHLLPDSTRITHANNQ